MFQCSPCGKIFTGRVSYDQHVKSDKHKKKMIESSSPIIQNGSSMTFTSEAATLESKSNESIVCQVCNLSFYSVDSFQCHSVTSEHALKVMLKSAESNDQTVTSSRISPNNLGSKDSRSKAEEADNDDLILTGFENDIKSPSLSFRSCHVCKKEFSGPEPFNQHLASEKHKKKVALQDNQQAVGGYPITFSCEHCKKTFSGQVPYIQHMDSKAHKKKLQHFQDIQNFLSDTKKPTKIENHNAGETANMVNHWFCKFCNMQCSGLIPFEQHLVGSSHIKNAKRAQALSNDFTSVDGITSVMRDDVKGNKASENLENDSVLPGLTDKLKTMSSEELKKSMKVFYPEDQINFDATHKDNENFNQGELKKSEDEIKKESENLLENNRNASGEDTSNVNIVDEEEKIVVFEMCSLCNVQFDKDNIAKHYESAEHIQRRWGLNVSLVSQIKV